MCDGKLSKVLSFPLCTADVNPPSIASSARNSSYGFASMLKTFDLGT